MANTEVKANNTQVKPKEPEMKGVKKEDIMSPWKIVWKRLRKNKLAMIGIAIIAMIAIAAIFADVITPNDRDAVDLRNRYKSPGTYTTMRNGEEVQVRYILGTDDMGRDIFTRLVYGARVSLTVGLVSVSISMTIGIVLGGISGYYGGKIDNAIMRFTDMVMCFPGFLIMITFVSIMGPSFYNTMIILGILGWTGICRMIRGNLLALRETEFMEAATALGISDRRKIFRHLLPNTMAPVIVGATMGIAGAILTESGLSYLGLGVQIPTPSWGNILKLANSHFILKNYWWVWVPPGLSIFITVMCLNFIGDGLRDALDPRLKQ